MPPLRDTGGGGGTIVVDIAGVRRASALLADSAHAFSLLAGRVRARPLPEMPADVAGRVAAGVGDVAQELASLPAPLVDTAQELRVRAFWAEIADALAAGYDLHGAQLTEFKAAYASGLLTRYADPGLADLARSYAKELHDREHPGGFAGFVNGVGDFFTGAWDAIKDPAVMLYHLTPADSHWTQHWQQLGHGLEYGVTHPLQFGRAVIGLDALQQHGFGYWLGNLAPSVAATVFTGGGAAGLRAAGATDRVVEGAAAADRLAEGAVAAERAGRAAEEANAAARAAERAADLERAANKAAGINARVGETIDVGGQTLPAYNGGKTTGIFEAGGNQLPLKSGYSGPTSELPKTGNPGMSYFLRSHVEAHAAAEMKLRDINEAELYINRIPCLNPASNVGCETMLERMLPEGAKLTVHGPYGYLKTFVGRPR